MCWVQPQVIINMVRHNSASTLTSLNLEGYEELNDLVLEFISGVNEEDDDDDDDEEEEKDCGVNSSSNILDDENKKIDSKENKTRGLRQLINLTLPAKSFVTTSGLRVLLENLPCLETIKNAGKMGEYYHRLLFS